MNKHSFNHEPAPRRKQNSGRQSTRPKTGKVPVGPRYHERMKTLKLLKAIEDGQSTRYHDER